MLNIRHNGREYANFAVPDLIAAGVPSATVGAAAKAWAIEEVHAKADAMRTQVARRSAAKLIEYRFKEEIARDPASASADELSLIDREAAAWGLDRDGMLALILGQAAIFRQVALLMGAVEAEMKAPLDVIPADAPDIEARIDTALNDASALAETALSEAQTLLQGGS